MSNLFRRCLPIAVLCGLLGCVVACASNPVELSDCNASAAESPAFMLSGGETDDCSEAKRTVTTIVDADSEAEAIAKAKKRYPKCTFTGVRKSGNHYIVTLECNS